MNHTDLHVWLTNGWHLTVRIPGASNVDVALRALWNAIEAGEPVRETRRGGSVLIGPEALLYASESMPVEAA